MTHESFLLTKELLTIHLHPGNYFPFWILPSERDRSLANRLPAYADPSFGPMTISPLLSVSGNSPKRLAFETSLLFSQAWGFSQHSPLTYKILFPEPLKSSSAFDLRLLEVSPPRAWGFVSDSLPFLLFFRVSTISSLEVLCSEMK